MTDAAFPAPRHFLESRICEDRESGLIPDGPVTRFPPEPNGFLHIGHAKSICLNFGLAKRYGGRCHLRFDDTNPEAEEQQFLDAIQDDIRWLGFEWDGPVRYTSAYFETLYEYALHLIQNGDAYVCDLTPDEAREYRGTLTEAGRPSPYRSRTVAENLELFAAMRAGKFQNGERVLRARIDMASPNMNMRDPILYRIRHAEHHQTGTTWCIYPTYDFAHGQSDALEEITHSLCSLEFEDHRPLYEWLIDHLPVPAKPTQIEFARLELNYTITSKRKLRRLVEEKFVDSWDDPRMPTISGMRRRGYPAAGIRQFIESAGVSRANSLTDVGMLEAAIRDELNRNAPRAMAVLDPLRVVIDNLPDNHRETLEAPAHPDREDLGVRSLPFGREILIEAEDFREEANKKYKRLTLGKRVRLRNAYVIEATSCEKDADGNIICVHANVVEGTLGQDPADGIKAKGVIHWVHAKLAPTATVRLYDRLFQAPEPGKASGEFLDDINPESLRIVRARVEPALAEASPEQSFQFERLGYFVADKNDHGADSLVFNRTIGLRDTWESKGK